jgi:hypothetical protein
MKQRKFLSFWLIVLLLVVGGIFSTNAQRPAAALDWLPITKQNKPWTRWWWLGSIVNQKDLTTEMAKYQKAGLGGLEITPIYGVKGYEDRFINFLSPQWMAMLEHTLKEAERLGLGVDLATGTGWPFGGPWVGDADASKYFASKTWTLKGGERLNEAISLMQKPLVRAVNRRVNISELKDPVSANENLQALALDQVRFEKPLLLQTLMAYSDKAETIDLTNKVAQDSKLDWTAPAGNWTLYAIFQGWHGKQVERAGPGGEGNVIDHFSASALKNYLRKFDQALARRNLKGLRGYFNDSYEVDDADGQSNWTPNFLAEFQKRRGYDLRNYLSALLGQDTADKNARVLTDFRETISDLLLDEFTLPWQRWAAGQGKIVRNQSHGSPANILDLYAASDIPETEGQEILRMKFASSAAHVTGKQLASSEAATWLNEHTLATLGDVKQAADKFFLGGVNHICYHGTPFSPESAEWPGFRFYAAVHFGTTNPFWDDFATLNRYVARCQSFLQAGKPDNDVLLYYPIYDSWAQPAARGLLQHYGGGIESALGLSDGQALMEAGYSFDLISDRQLAKVQFAGGALQTGGTMYKAIVLPETKLIPPATFAKLIELARRGATVIVRKSLPADVPGLGNLEARRSALQQLTAQLKFGPADMSGNHSAQLGAGRFLMGGELPQLLAAAAIRRETLGEQGLQFVRRRHERGHYYFVVNQGKQPLNGWVALQTNAKAVALFDPLREEKGLAALRAANGVSEVYLQLAPGESCILKTFNTTVSGAPFIYFKAQGEAQPLAGKWSVRFVAGGPELPMAVETSELTSWTNFAGEAVKRFSGTANYTLTFAKPQGQAEAWLLDLGRVAESARVKLNGKELGTLITAPYQIRLPKELLREQNTLELAVTNLETNRIIELDQRRVNWKRFYNTNMPARRRENAGPDGLFTAARWPWHDSGLMGPVTSTPLAHRRPDKE